MALDFIVNTSYILENGKKLSAKKFESKVKQRSVGEFMLERYIELGNTHEEALEMEYENYISGLKHTKRKSSTKVHASLTAVDQSDVDKYQGLFGWINYPITKEGDEYLYILVEKSLRSHDEGMHLLFDFIHDYKVTGKTFTSMRQSQEAAFFEVDEAYTFRTKYGIMNLDMVYESLFNIPKMHMPHIMTLLAFTGKIYLKPKGRHLKENYIFVSMIETLDNPKLREFFSFEVPDISEFVSINQINRFFMVLYNAFILNKDVLIER